MPAKVDNRASGKRLAKLQKRRKEAQERQVAYEDLTPKQRLAKLDRKLGVNVGAVRERGKLTGLLKK
jgi:Spy/CpxP family protein refolding chaperone